MILVWLWIGLIVFVLVFVCNCLFFRDLCWFNCLCCFFWLIFEWVIFFIWIVIFIVGVIFVILVWNVMVDLGYCWGLMVGYFLLELIVMVYIFVMCKFWSLRVGSIIGVIGFFVGFVLVIVVS